MSLFSYLLTSILTLLSLLPHFPRLYLLSLYQTEIITIRVSDSESLAEITA